MGRQEITVDYDDAADVLYVSFGPPRAAVGEMTDSGVILRYADGELVGITILEFWRRFVRDDGTLDESALASAVAVEPQVVEAIRRELLQPA